MKKIICITGMHRSGTSLTASWLELCGLAIHDGKKIGPGPGNLKGHFEDQEFVDLHAAAIKLVKPKSAGWKLNNNTFLSFNGKQLSEANMLIRQRNAKYDLWGWKDPRTVFFLRHWKELIPSLKVVLIWRPFLEVTQSLIRRSKKTNQAVFKIRPIEAAKLWLTYNQKICEYMTDFSEDTLLFSFNDIIHRDRQAMDIILKTFNIDIHYQSIDAVFDNNLTKNISQSIFLLICKSILRCSKTEEKLAAYSNHG